MTRLSTLKKAPATRRSATDGKIRTYRSALNYLNSAVNYERKPPAPDVAGGFTLGRMRRLLTSLGNPHRQFKSVHIAGSKGKGSTVAMLAGMLRHSGYKVGVFTSPHIMHVRERITVNDREISELAFARLMNVVAAAARKPRVGNPTYFELLTAAAFTHFASEKVDIAVIETGMGGRLDATNVIKPEAVGITSINFDHAEQLGGTVEAIAREKAGVFKSKVPVTASPQTPAVEQILRTVAEETESPIRMTGGENVYSFRFESSRALGPHTRICVTTATSRFEHVHAPLPGDHQALNCALALGILDSLKGRGFDIDDHKAVEGLVSVSLPGRMEMIQETPRVMVDGAHNAASVDALMRAIGQNVPYDSMVIIFGCRKDKDIAGMLRHIRLGADKIIFTSTGSPRATDPMELASAFAEISTKMCQVADDLEEAMSIAVRAVSRDDLICITGSFALVARAKRLLAK
ncbi:MAG: folylpolyglutamate synthase/dihydrofolate synthase family protein [Phycisphaerae bacterium]